MEEIIIDDRCKQCEFYDEYGAICNLYSCHDTNYCVTSCVDKCILLRKEKECEELKEKLKTLDDSVITYELTESDFKKYNKLKQALQEIKKYIKDNEDFILDNTIQDILQIISEVEK